MSSDRESYARFLQKFGYTESFARAVSENTEDQLALGLEAYGLAVAPSLIEGLGIFATAPIPKGARIAPARLGRKRTQLGRYMNHAETPNAEMIGERHGDVGVYALRDIEAGAEITVDYASQSHFHGLEA